MLVNVCGCLTRQRVSIARVESKRLLEQRSRRLVLVLVVPGVVHQHIGAHRKVDCVRVLRTRALFRLRFEEFIAQAVGEPSHDLVLQLEKVGDVVLDAIGPEVRAGIRIDELSIDAHPVLVALRRGHCQTKF